MAVPRPLRDLVAEAARGIGRSPADVQPFARTLAENWFDSADSLASCRPEELAALGIPLRFAQQLVAVAGGAGGGKGGGGGGRDPRRGPPPAPGKGGGGSGGGGGGPHRDAGPGPRTRVLRVKDFQPEFRARGSILGAKGRNLHHIQDQTGVKVDLRGDPEPREMVFSEAPSPAELDRAVQMGKDLLHTVSKQYGEWLREQRDANAGRREAAARGDKGGGKGGGGGGASRATKEAPAEAEFQTTVELRDMDPKFGIRGRVLGSKGRNVRDIEQQTGASLAVKLGGEGGEGARLEIGAPTAEALVQAQELVEALLVTVYEQYDDWQRSREEGRGSKRKSDAVDSVTQTLDVPECDPRFTIRGRVLGAQGRNLRHIEEETGARLELQGKEGEALKLKISSPDQDVVDRAVAAAEDLLSALNEDYLHWLDEEGAEGSSEGKGKGEPNGKGGHRQDQGRRKGTPKGGGGGAGGGGGGGPGQKGGGGPPRVPGEQRKILRLKECDPDFDLRNALRGNKCENLHHIQDETGAKLWCLGEAGEPVRLEISGQPGVGLDQAVQMAKDLIKTVFREYDAWLKKRGRGGAGGDPSAKRQRASPDA